MKKLFVTVDLKNVKEVKDLIDSAKELIHEIRTTYYKDNLGRDLVLNPKFIDFMVKTPNEISIKFTDWYRLQTGSDWHEDYAWVESEKVYEYEEYCKLNGIEPVYDG